MRNPYAFTIVELLVVITIIVVLLALLAPAMDKAMYEAELAICQVNQRGIVAAVDLYAVDHGRRYPSRSAVGQVQANVLAYQDIFSGLAYFDDRPLMFNYLNIQQFLCPLTAKVDLRNTPPDATVYASYLLYYGWRFTGPSTDEKGRFKLGDRMTFDHKPLSVMTADWDRIDQTGSHVWCSHPDHDGAMVDKISTVLSAWFLNSDYRRSPIELNASKQDESVVRFNNVRWDEWEHHTGLTKIAEFANGAAFGAGLYNHVPVD